LAKATTLEGKVRPGANRMELEGEKNQVNLGATKRVTGT